MPNVETVRGPVDTADLGQVLAHEHVFILSHEFIVNYPDIEGFDADRAVEAAVVRMNDLVDAGVGTIVDLTVAGLGRDVALVQRVAEQTALNIVVATGYYTFTELPFFVEVRARFSGGDLADMLAGWFIGDITEGIAHTGVKAGILKCATDHPGRDAGGRGGPPRGGAWRTAPPACRSRRTPSRPRVAGSSSRRCSSRRASTCRAS